MNDPKRMLTALQEILLPYDTNFEVPVEKVLRLYIKAVKDFDVELVELAATMFTRGEVPSHNGRHRPPPGIVANACRLAANRRDRERYLEALARPLLQERPQKRSPESRARVKQMVDDFIRNRSFHLKA